ncbi:hypothetical protein BI291_03665 [Thalassotalea sp. PP2-459]|nr:hypothetical protein BI291_03665 [Thalassotalea sp. PP2-459]
MLLAQHLQNYAESKYLNIINHTHFRMQDCYVFTANRLLAELNKYGRCNDLKVEIITIEYDNKTGIPTFILLANHNLKFLLNKYELEFTSNYSE